MKRKRFDSLLICKAGTDGRLVGFALEAKSGLFVWIDAFTPARARKIAGYINQMADEIDGAKP